MLCTGGLDNTRHTDITDITDISEMDAFIESAEQQCVRSKALLRQFETMLFSPEEHVA